jgi:hypothetical protein
MRLEDVEVEPFGMLVHWLYTQSLSDCVKETDNQTQLLQLGKLWTLAGRCLIPRLQNTVMDHLPNMLRNLNPGKHSQVQELINHVYKTSKESTPLKKLVVDHLAWNIPRKFLEQWIPDLPKGMVTAIALTLKEQFSDPICARQQSVQ